MNNIIFNSGVAARCGKNGIIKAVLINYIYNYYVQNPRKGAGYPAPITLKEFVYQYSVGDGSLWKRSFVHRILRDLKKDGQITITQENNRPVYAVSSAMAELLSDENATLISFDLGMACEYGIHIAIISRYLSHVISKSPNNVAYNLSVKEMAEVNHLSPAQIYRAIKHLVDTKVLARVKMRSKSSSRALSLILQNPNKA
jgi:predicted transcriptional regulator